MNWRDLEIFNEFKFLMRKLWNIFLSATIFVRIFYLPLKLLKRVKIIYPKIFSKFIVDNLIELKFSITQAHIEVKHPTTKGNYELCQVWILKVYSKVSLQKLLNKLSKIFSLKTPIKSFQMISHFPNKNNVVLNSSRPLTRASPLKSSFLSIF